ncbi:MAG: GDP-mannose 4,6-dehydratase [candidate division Zixibacteria bacterium]|nr:GDP-mannose 4,6-dehydratase [candidate division Zixibacteria bacterium]
MNRPLAFITGITGFAGSWLAEELLDNNYRVAGSVYPGESTEHIDHIRDRLTLSRLDLLKPDRVASLIKKISPDYLFHLAAFSSVGQSFSKERLTFRVNLEGTLNILMAARESGKMRKIIYVSSSDCYGRFSPKNKTLTEDQPLNPVSPYGVSKAATEQLCRMYVNRYDLPISIARSFNHSGPRQSDNFVIPSFARQIVSIENGKQKPVMLVGNLSVKRDLSDVRDIVRGYRLIAEKGRPGRVYQLCSGRAVAISSVLEQFLRLSTVKIKVKTDKARLRKNDIPVMRGDNGRATTELGFSVRYRLKTTLDDTLNYWRMRS